MNSPVNPSFRELSREQRLLVHGVRNLLRLGEKAGGGQDLDPLIGMDDAGAKRDGRNVSFAGGAQAQNEAQRAGRQFRLIGVRNDGGIEQGRRFQRVFGQEIGSDQQPSCFGHFRIGRQRLADLFEALQEEIANLLVALGELSADLGEQFVDAVFRKCHDPLDDRGDALGTTRVEGPQENARLVGIQDRGGTFDVDGHDWQLLR